MNGNKYYDMTDKQKLFLDKIVKILVDTTNIVPISKDVLSWDGAKYRLNLPFLNSTWVSSYEFKKSSKFTNTQIIHSFELYVMDHFGITTNYESEYIWDKYKTTIMGIIKGGGDTPKRGYYD